MAFEHIRAAVFVVIGLCLARPVLPFPSPYLTTCTYRIDHSNSAGCRTISVSSVTKHEDEIESCFAGSFDGKRQYMFFVQAESPVTLSFAIQFKYQRLNLGMPKLNSTDAEWVKVEVEVNDRKGMRVKTRGEEIKNLNCSNSNVEIPCNSLNISGTFKMYLHIKGNVWWTPYCIPTGEPYKTPDATAEDCLILIIVLVIVSILLLIVSCYAVCSFLAKRGFSVKDRLSFMLPETKFCLRPSVLRPNTRLAIYREDNIYEDDSTMTDCTETTASPVVSPTHVTERGKSFDIARQK